MADELVKVVDPVKFTDNEIALIKRTVAEGATDDELALFLYQARRTQLDPLARQIHFVKRGGKATIQTGIDGYRLVADRSGKYAGNDNPVYEGEVETPDGPAPLKATVTVWKMVAGQRVAFSATAHWYEYYPGDGGAGFMWRKMPCLMLGKVAESLALRKAFPAELSGVYTQEEMAQADREDDRRTGGMAPVVRISHNKVDESAATGNQNAGNGKPPAPAKLDKLTCDLFAGKVRDLTPKMSDKDRGTLIAKVGKATIEGYTDWRYLAEAQLDPLLTAIKIETEKGA